VEVYDPVRLLPFGMELDLDREIAWAMGTSLFGDPLAVPLDAVTVGAAEPDLADIARTTNGLASGNTEEEARFHGTCELVERDAVTLWSLSGAGAGQKAIDPESFDDWAVSDLAERVADAGFGLRLFDLTSDLGVPTILAVIGGGPEEERRHFGLTAGYGCHPVAARAAIRAITESAQSRITLIAGARDDIDPEDFGRALDGAHARLLTAAVGADAPRGMPAGTPLASLHAHLRERIAAAGIDLVAVPLGGEEYGIHVVRMLSQALEDREPNRNWRPGPRALTVLLG
jgi:ribosomal protein S12 methylthiotransferase accessory factor